MRVGGCKRSIGKCKGEESVRAESHAMKVCLICKTDHSWSSLPPSPRSKTRLLRPVPMSLALLGFGSLKVLIPVNSRSIRLSPCFCVFAEDDVLLAWPMTPSTQASLSGLIDIRLERGVGPARPKGVECLEEPVYGECPFAPSPATEKLTEFIDATDKRREDGSDSDGVCSFVSSPISEAALEGRLL